MKFLRIFGTLFILFISTTNIVHAQAKESLQRFEFQHKQMGTLFKIVLYTTDPKKAQDAAKASFARVDEFNRILSDYDPSSEIMKVCKTFAKQTGEAVKISKDLFYLLEQSKAKAKESDGAFDVTISPVVKLWRLSRRTQRLPDPNELKNALSKVGSEHMELDPTKQTVRFLIPGMELDFGGIAKGYAADEVLKLLATRGIESALVAAGGDIAVSKAPPGEPYWKIDIEPIPGSKETETIGLVEGAVSTSGDSENYCLIDGIRYSHIVDPKTGIGLTGQRSVTVIARHGIDSDSLTKVGSILPPKKAIAFFNKLPKTELRILYRKDKGELEKYQTKGFRKYRLEKMADREP